MTNNLLVPRTWRCHQFICFAEKENHLCNHWYNPFLTRNKNWIFQNDWLEFMIIYNMYIYYYYYMTRVCVVFSALGLMRTCFEPKKSHTPRHWIIAIECNARRMNSTASNNNRRTDDRWTSWVRPSRHGCSLLSERGFRARTSSRCRWKRSNCHGYVSPAQALSASVPIDRGRSLGVTTPRTRFLKTHESCGRNWTSRVSY